MLPRSYGQISYRVFHPVRCLNLSYCLGSLQERFKQVSTYCLYMLNTDILHVFVLVRTVSLSYHWGLKHKLTVINIETGFKNVHKEGKYTEQTIHNHL